jgi:hypothetical protein
VGTLVRLYVGWRLLRLLRPIIAAAVIAAAVLALHTGHLPVKGAGSSSLVRGAVAAQRDLSRALESAFVRPRR